MRRPRAISLPASVALIAIALAGAGCGDGAQLVPADEARSLDSTLQQVSDATKAGECSQALSSLANARRLYAALPDSVDERLTARIREGLDHLERTVPEQCSAVPATPQRTPTTTDAPASTTTNTAPTTTTTTTTPTTTTTTTPPATTTQTTPTATTPNGGIAPEAPTPGTAP